MQLGASQAGGHRKAQRVFREQASFAVQADVVAVGFHGKSAGFDSLRTQALLPLHLLGELRAKVDILRVVAGRIGVGDVRRHQLLPDTQQVHVLFEISGDSFKHDIRVKAVLVPSSKRLILNLDAAENREEDVVNQTIPSDS